MDKAINCLDENEIDDFKNFVNKSASFNRENLFFVGQKK